MIILISLTCMYSFLGCEKVIDLKLADASPKIVIDAGINDESANQLVRISKTYSFTEPNQFNGVSGAKVIVTTESGIQVTYSEISPGIYQSQRFRGRAGNSYTMDVTVEGKTYTATSRMPDKVILDSISFKELDVFGKSHIHAAANFEDPPGVANQYRYILKLKGKTEEDFVSEDRFNDGNHVSNIVFHELDDLVSGDNIEMELQCIDRNVYRYFYSLGQNSGGGGPPVSPANPPSNFSNGALGVFNAFTTSSKSLVLK